MKNTFGESVCVTLFGESHGTMIGAVLDGMAPGIPVDEAQIAAALARRRPAGALATARHEQDRFSVVSGVHQGKTTGAPLCILIPNEDVKSGDYESWRGLARPSHADYTAFCKYHGFEDPRGGGHFSGRLTAPLVALGAVAAAALRRRGIRVGTHLASLAGVFDRPAGDLAADLTELERASFPMWDEDAAAAAATAVLTAKEEKDSVGGVTETFVTGLPAGVGEPWFGGVESALSAALFAIPAIKGVEFGAGFALAQMRGSEANDAFYIKNDTVAAKTNHNGGINGGITNGMPLVVRCAVKPTPSIAQAQETVDFFKKENATLTLSGRHDPAIAPRVCPVATAVTALVLCDLLALRFGTDWLGGTV